MLYACKEIVIAKGKIALHNIRTWIYVFVQLLILEYYR